MAPFLVIYVNFLENLDNFLSLMAWAEISVLETVWKRILLFSKSILFQRKKAVKVLWLPIWTDSAIFICCGKLLSTRKQKHINSLFLFFQEIPSWENFNSTLNQVCNFFRIWRFLRERWTFWRMLNLFIVLRSGERMINVNVKGICNFWGCYSYPYPWDFQTI